MAGTIGIVMGRMNQIAGYLAVNDVSIPHASYYRPAIRQRCRDGFCVIGSETTEHSPQEIRILINGELRVLRQHAGSGAADPSLDCRYQRVSDARTRRHRSGRRAIRCAIGAGRRSSECASGRVARDRKSRGAGMKSARVAYAGGIHHASSHNGRLRLTDGRVVAEDAVVWLPPVQPGTIFALGLNYADHAKELAFKAPDEPLVFLKGPQSLCGHLGKTRRPQGVTYMHYECELAVVIGKTARRVSTSECVRLRRRIHRRQRLRHSRLSGELLSPELPREEP